MRFWTLPLFGALFLVGNAAHAQPGPAPQSAPSKPTGVAPQGSPVPSRTAILTKADLDAWLDGYLPYALRTADIPGAVVVVVKDGAVVTARGFGYADLEARSAVDPERTLFRTGSISKLITWTAAMQLVEQHKLDLDRDVNAYLDFRIPPRDGRPVTLRQLMTHTAGFEEVGKGVVFYDPTFYLPLDGYLKRWTPRRIFAPGTTPAYSNYGTALAAYMVQRVSGEPFETYLDRHIFDPLGMRNSTFRQPLPANLAPQMAKGYPKPGEPSPGFEIVGPGPAGAQSSTAIDMARFMIAHLQNGELDGHRILSPETAQMMHDSPLGPVDAKSLVPPLSRMELGFFETNINGREVIGHLGDTEGFHSSLHLFTKEGAGLFVSFNSPGKSGAVQALRTGVFQDFADRYFPDSGPADGRVDAKTAAEHAGKMAGNWWASRRAESSFLSIAYLLGQARASVGPKGELVIPSIVGPGGRPREWVEIAPFVWRDRDGHDRLAAKLVDGQVVRWSFDFASPFEVFDRVPLGKSSVWIMPAACASLAVLLLTFLFWPVAWAIRRRYQASLSLTGPALRAYRTTGLMAGLELLVLAGWTLAFTKLLASADALAGGLDAVIWLLQFASAVILIGAVPVFGWNLWLTWTDGRKWTRKAWSLLTVLASLTVLYVATRFGLIALTVNY